ncbi:hypothetical protein [Nonomuraea dietziae]|uniref:hypothetical protein n=1 Tax=Nonomuraea dietziae TaxID=65515 RepID=UPI00340708B5
MNDAPIILIGGASGTGKSQVSYPLARRLASPIVEIDDIVEALQAMTTPEQLPALHYWRANPEAVHLPPERIVEMQISVARALVPAVRAVVANHLETMTPVVVEGDYLLPSTAAELDGVRAVFLHEGDEEQIAENYRRREPAAGAQHGRAMVSRLYGDWLASQAEAAGVPVVPARPWDDVLERVVRALDLASPAV